MKDNNIVLDKSKAFALRIIGMYRYLTDEKHEYVMSKQVLKSGTSIGAYPGGSMRSEYGRFLCQNVYSFQGNIRDGILA